jgi:hypothetical protein
MSKVTDKYKMDEVIRRAYWAFWTSTDALEKQVDVAKGAIFGCTQCN